MPTPDRYAVIGYPVAHSRSPQIHALFAQQTRQNMIYDALPIAPGELGAAVREFFAAGGRGLNVTLPHKQAALALSDTLTAQAQQAGAVNTLALQTDGRLLGDNTDGIGFVRDLTVNRRVPVTARRVLLLGAGGASRGLLAPLLALEPHELMIANRSIPRARELAGAFSALGNVRHGGFADLDGQQFDLIINATSASLADEVPALPADIMSDAIVCYDLAYAQGSNATAFLRWARSLGVSRAFGGLGMLVEQAAESFLLWRGVRPQTAPVLAALAR